MEKLFKFLEFNLEDKNKVNLFSLKKKFNNDLNLFGCFLKDFLLIELKNNKISDENLYNDFVIYFDSKETLKEKHAIFDKLCTYAKYYIMLVFENADNKDLLNAISTINSCCAIYSYPYLMIVMDNYFNQKIDGKTFTMMLKLIVDIVLKYYEEDNDNNMLSIESFEKDLGKMINSKERLAS